MGRKASAKCRCGSPPYTDGRPCPVCFEIIAEERMARPDFGFADAAMLLVMAMPNVRRRKLPKPRPGDTA